MLHPETKVVYVCDYAKTKLTDPMRKVVSRRSLNCTTSDVLAQKVDQRNQKALQEKEGNKPQGILPYPNFFIFLFPNKSSITLNTLSSCLNLTC
jgi:hypothetical protein